MACIIKRPDSKFFIACWTDATGRRMKRSTKEVSKTKAEKIARLFEAESRTKRTAIQVRRVLADIHRDLSGAELPTETVREFFARFILEKKPSVSSATYAYYGGHGKRFLKWLGSRADADIANVTRTDITTYRNLIREGAGPRTTNNTLKAIKAFFAGARKEGLLADDPCAAVDTVRDRSESNKRPFTLDELRRLLAVANPEWRSMILFGLYLGQRLGDIAMLTWGNLNAEKGETILTTRKTGRKQELPFPPPLRAHIESLERSKNPKDPLHPEAFKKVSARGLTTKLSDQFALMLKKAGLRDEVQAEEGNARAKHELSFHSLRHTATSLLKAAGVPQSVVMAYVGHDSAEVSHGYTHTGREAMEKAAAAFPEL